jgi:signal transduction histidine kinase
MKRNSSQSEEGISRMETRTNSQAVSRAASERTPAADRVNILLVDDEERNLTVLETILDNPGYRLVRAETADQALLALVQEEFALIVLDIHLPGMSGFELAHMIKQRKKTAGIPIIFLTAYYSENEHVLDGYETGAVDYLHKQVNATILRSKVAVFVDLHRKTRETALANHALFDEVLERRRIQDELVELNLDLERRVRERTSELLKANSALRESDRRKDEFLAMLAHELRNPLAPIRNSLEILKMPRIDPGTAQQTRSIMERQIHQLVRLVDDLLDVSRVMRGKITLQRETVELATVVARAVEAAQPLIDVQGHRLDISLPPDSLLLSADPVRLTQVIGNLLMNSAKYTDANGHILLSAHREGDQAILSVRDNGIGITPEVLPHIFDLFVQADHASAKAQGGLGIGLTLVKNLVKLHDGMVAAHSAGLGQGSEFVIRLPLTANRPEEGTESEQSEKQMLITGHRLLVVDDNRDAADSLAMWLRLEGHEVHTAHDGPSALDAAFNLRPAMIFLDIGMPEMDGFEVARRIRNSVKDHGTVLVALTGWGQLEDRRRTAEAGFDQHLVKPPEPSALKNLLSALNQKPT